MSKSHYFPLKFDRNIILLYSFIRIEIFHQFKKFVFSFKFERKCKIIITRFGFNGYYTNLFGKLF